MGQLAAIKAFSLHHPLFFLPLAALLWLGLYLLILPGSELLVSWLPVPRQSQLGSALQFFLYDTPKVLLLLTGIVFVMGMINSWFTPERTRALLAGRCEGGANVLAALLGIVTPFCSCSAVPLFIGFVQAGVPLGVTFSFLISAPMVNEVALTLLFGLVGWKVALLYLGVIALIHLHEDRARGLKMAGYLAIVGTINLPIIKFSVEWWNTLHQPASIRLSGSSIHPDMLTPLLLSALGFLLLFAALVLIRMRALIAEQRLEARALRRAARAG